MKPGPALALVAAACGASPDADGTVEARWEHAAPVPEGRTEVSVATDGSRIYLIGGFGPGAGRRPSAPREMFVYDPSTDRWSAGGEIPEGVNHAGFAAVGGRLYIVGGFRGTTFSPTGAVRVYDPATRGWQDGTPMLTPRGALAVAVLDGRIHAIGGNAASGAGLQPHEHGAPERDNSVGTHEAYDPVAGTWIRLAPLPTPRNHLGAAVIGGRIHVVGGRVPGDMELPTHEIYDAKTDSWTAGPPMPTGRSGIAVVGHRGQLYVFGGETVRRFSSRTFDDAERFDPGSARWETLSPMPTARHGLGAASSGGAIYVLGGGPRPGLAFGAANERLVPP
ncbi:MAG TPA: kelch repeat-containing protein [Gemmatimonadales bacterium]|nr:kelch repeat-containing protein [Gemmatimonadales bacterium]